VHRHEESVSRSLQVLSALFLLAMGGIHLYLVLQGFGGLVGALFVLNALAGLVMAVAMVVARKRLVLASVLSLLLMAGTLLALVLALTVGLLGIREQLSGQLVVPTLVVESVGAIVLVVTTVVARRRGASVPGRIS
jgi:hypothetical protein